MDCFRFGVSNSFIIVIARGLMLCFFFPCFPVFFCFPVFLLFFGRSYFGPAFWTEATSYVLHIPRVKHLPAILASVIAHDPALCIMAVFQEFNRFYISPLMRARS